MMLSLSYIAFVILRYIPIPSFFRAFYNGRMLNFVKGLFQPVLRWLCVILLMCNIKFIDLHIVRLKRGMEG
jgi:hypothetical protein